MVLSLSIAVLLLQAPEDQRLSGQWRDADLQLVSEFKRDADGTWSAVVVAGPRAADVGKRTFEKLVWQEKRGVFSGKLIKPDDGQVVDVTLTLDSASAMTGSAGFFIFRKTLHFTRVTEDGGTR
jgi:hypothetical protein